MYFITDLIKKYWKRNVFTYLHKEFMLTSRGYKRLLASLLLVVATVLNACGLVTVYLPVLAASMGGVGIVHAVAEGKSNYWLATIASLLAVAQYIPFLSPYVPLLQEIAALFGAGALGQKIGEVKQYASSSNNGTGGLHSV